ncbi:MAG TPA: response regulator [Nitrososphaeraceae archaeon]|nr:response regulator [Nitrososphaeraceae archaeon]
MPLKSNSKSILLVDDESDIVNLFKCVLESRNYEVYGSTNPLEALKHYKTNYDKYELVISDIRMPGMTGFELVKIVKKINTAISIFLMSTYDTIDYSKLDGRTIDGFIQKPIQIEKLLSKIEKHFDHYQYNRIIVDNNYYF